MLNLVYLNLVFGSIYQNLFYQIDLWIHQSLMMPKVSLYTIDDQ